MTTDTNTKNLSFGAQICRLFVGNRSWNAPESHLPDGKQTSRYLVAAMIAGLACLAFAAKFIGMQIVVNATIAFAAASLVELIFAMVRKQEAKGGALTFAVLLALLLPVSAPIWTIAVTAVFGTIFGKEVFGGAGDYLFNPVVIAVLFFYQGYASLAGHDLVTFSSIVKLGDTTFDLNSPTYIGASLVTVAGMIACIVARPKSIVIFLVIIFSALIVAYGLATYSCLNVELFKTPINLLLANGFLFIVCFLACDPSTVPTRFPAVVAYGLIIGAGTMLLTNYSDEGTQTIIPLAVILLANMFGAMFEVMFTPSTSTPAGEN